MRQTYSASLLHHFQLDVVHVNRTFFFLHLPLKSVASLENSFIFRYSVRRTKHAVARAVKKCEHSKYRNEYEAGEQQHRFNDCNAM